MPTVFVIGSDWTLRANVRAELREAGIEALGMETMDEAGQAIARGEWPAAAVLEAAAGEPNPTALGLLAKRVPVVVVASRTETVPLPEDAAVVLYRPVRVADIVARVKQLLEGQAA